MTYLVMELYPYLICAFALGMVVGWYSCSRDADT